MKKRVFTTAVSVALSVALLAGCGASTTSNSSKSTEPPAKSSTETTKKKDLGKLVVAYSGGTCEAPQYAAYHEGIFKEEGLDVEFTKMDFETLKTGIASGKVDATVGNFAWFKAIEQGLAIKLTAGLHAGCISVVVPPNSPVKKLEDFKGKTVGVEATGGGPQIILSSELKKLGVDPKTEVQWKTFPIAELATAAEKGEIAGFITWDPFPTNAVKDKNFTQLFSISTHEPYKSGYCCFAVVSDKLLKENKEKAQAFTRAIVKAAEYVGQNPEKVSQLEIDNKYVATTHEHNTKLIKSYEWKPSTTKVVENIKFFIHEQKELGILEKDTDEKELFDNLFVDVLGSK